jgi:signal transduction histidine kinase
MSADPQHPAERLRRRGTLLATAFLLMAAVGLGVGAWQLARSQSHDRADLRNRYASRAGVASALIDSLFRLAFTQQAQEAGRRFGHHVGSKQLTAFAARSQLTYAAVLSQGGVPIAATPGAPAHPGASVVAAAIKQNVAVSDLIHSPRGDVIESAVRFPVAHHLRIYVTASPAATFKTFLTGSLRPLVPVEGGEAYVLDSHGMVLGAVSANRPRRPPSPSRVLVRDSAARHSGFYRLQGDEQYFATAPQPETKWRIVLSAPTSSLYRPASGVSRWLPWVAIGLLGFALLAIALLVARAISAAGAIALANERLERSQERLREHASDLRRANLELQRSNAELEQFAYVASHDLSAPLRAVAGFSQLLSVRYRGRLDANADEFIAHMQEGVDRMQRIIDDLLTYSRVDRSGLRATDVDLEGVLEEVLRVLEPDLAERGASVTHDSLPTVRGDRGQLVQLLQNLIANGVKFCRPGTAPAVHVSARPVGERWQVSVTDNGIGIEPAHAERVFEMFHRLHSADEYPGTGIGLAICKKIVERHDGEIRIAPAPDGGSVVTFDLPMTVPVDARTVPEVAAR